MSALNVYRAVWMAAFVQRRPGALSTVGWIAILMLVCGSVVGFYTHHWGPAMAVMAGIPAASFLLVWLFIFVPSAALMNTPANARLVPHMRRRIVEMVVAGWVCAWLLGLFMPAWQTANLVALWVIGVSTGRGGAKLGNLFVVTVGFWGMIWNHLPPALIQFLMSVPGFACATVAVAAFGLYSIRTTFPNGGERHCRQRHSQAEAIARLEGNAAKGTLRQRAQGVYPFVLGLACRGRKRSLLLHVFGPGGHWTAAVHSFAVMVALGAALKLVLKLGVGAQTQELVARIGWPFLTVLLFAHLAVMDYSRIRIGATKAEQKLFRLVPASPAAHELNRRLAVELVANALLSWAFVAGAMILLAICSGASISAVLTLGLLCSMFCLPSVALVLRDYAAEDHWLEFRMIIWLVAVFGSGAAAFLLQETVGIGTWIALALLVNAVGAAFVRLRFQKMVAAPVAFPAARQG